MTTDQSPSDATMTEPPALTAEQRDQWEAAVELVVEGWPEPYVRLPSPVLPAVAARLDYLEEFHEWRTSARVSHSAECFRWHLDCSVSRVERYRAVLQQIVDFELLDDADYAARYSDRLNQMELAQQALKEPGQ